MFKIAGTAALDAFTAAQRDGEAIRVWSTSPNGGPGGPVGEEDWGTDTWVDEILNEARDRLRDDPTSTEVHFDPVDRALEVCFLPPRGVHLYYRLRYTDCPDQGREHIAYSSAHAGFVWEIETPSQSEALRCLLEDGDWDDDTVAEWGIAPCEDYAHGDDGVFWLIQDPERFRAVVRRCQELDSDLDFEATPEAVRAALRS